MGGKGTFAVGNSVPFVYETVGRIGNVKIIEKINKNESRNLPEESHKSKAYILLDKSGVFNKYREYNKKHELLFEIEYGIHRGQKSLHYHPYIDGERQPAQEISKEQIKKYKKYFRGLTL